MCTEGDQSVCRFSTRPSMNAPSPDGADVVHVSPSIQIFGHPPLLSPSNPPSWLKKFVFAYHCLSRPRDTLGID